MKRRRFVNNIIIGIISVITIWLLLGWYKDKQIRVKRKEYNIKNVEAIYNVNSISENYIYKESVKEYPKANVINEYKGYKVLAKLEIPSINLETYILKTCNEASLNKSVAKFWGANPNQLGNCCIAGHNAPRNKNMFYNLKKLKIGDILTISDNIVGIIEYEVYDIYTVEPEDISVLSQVTNKKKEVTLITCTNDSQKRVIIKAKEID